MAFRFVRGFTLANPRHLGVDLAAARGTPIAAVSGGRVIYAADEQYDRHAPSYSRGGGRVVHVDVGGYRVHQYAHLDSIGVVAGQTISAGSFIGRVGSTGGGQPGQPVTGPHLHFAIWNRATIQATDPLRVMSIDVLIQAVSGSGAVPVSAPGDQEARAQEALRALASIGIPTSSSHVITPDEARRIATELYKVGGNVADAIARTFTGMTVARYVELYVSGANTNTSTDPFTAIADAIGSVPGALAGILAHGAQAVALIALVLVGLYLLVTSE